MLTSTNTVKKKSEYNIDRDCVIQHIYSIDERPKGFIHTKIKGALKIPDQIWLDTLQDIFTYKIIDAMQQKHIV
jgi:hypothetical protein